jgi:hypothetical protein
MKVAQNKIINYKRVSNIFARPQLLLFEDEFDKFGKKDINVITTKRIHC